MCLTPLLLKQFYVLLREGLVNYRIPSLKMLRLFELPVDIFRLFCSVIPEIKKIEKVMFKVKTGYIFEWSCDARASLQG